MNKIMNNIIIRGNKALFIGKTGTKEEFAMYLKLSKMFSVYTWFYTCDSKYKRPKAKPTDFFTKEETDMAMALDNNMLKESNSILYKPEGHGGETIPMSEEEKEKARSYEKHTFPSDFVISALKQRLIDKKIPFVASVVNYLFPVHVKDVDVNSQRYTKGVIYVLHVYGMYVIEGRHIGLKILEKPIQTYGYKSGNHFVITSWRKIPAISFKRQIDVSLSKYVDAICEVLDSLSKKQLTIGDTTYQIKNWCRIAVSYKYKDVIKHKYPEYFVLKDTNDDTFLYSIKFHTGFGVSGPRFVKVLSDDVITDKTKFDDLVFSSIRLKQLKG